MNPLELVRPRIKSISGYTPGYQPTEPGWVKLNTNENPFPPSPRVLSALKDELTSSLRLYPDPLAGSFLQAVSEVYDIPTEWLIAGNGSDELLNIVIRTFLEPGDRVVSPYPTYSLYDTLCSIQGAELLFEDFPEDYSLPELSSPAKLIFICNPNSPSGTSIPRSEIKALAESRSSIIVIDEAYALFADENCLTLVYDYPNVIVLRSLSKSHSLAGLRIGFGVANPKIIAQLIKVKDSYNLNRLSIVAGAEAIRDTDYTNSVINKVKQERAFLTAELRKLGFSLYPSQANFLFARPPSKPASVVFEKLKERRVIVRYFPGRLTTDYLRITVGDTKANTALIDALEEIINE